MHIHTHHTRTHTQTLAYSLFPIRSIFSNVQHPWVNLQDYKAQALVQAILFALSYILILTYKVVLKQSR